MLNATFVMSPLSEDDKVNISLAIRAGAETISSGNTELDASVDHLYANTVTHAAYMEIIEACEQAKSEYNRETIADIFDSIVSMDQQTYYDIICIISLIMQGQDSSNRTEYINHIYTLMNNSNNIMIHHTGYKPGHDAEDIGKDIDIPEEPPIDEVSFATVNDEEASSDKE